MHYLEPEILEVFIYLLYCKNKSIELFLYPAQKRLNIIRDTKVIISGDILYYRVISTSRNVKIKIEQSLGNLDLSYAEPEEIEDYKKVAQIIIEENRSATIDTMVIDNISYLKNIIDFSVMSGSLELCINQSGAVVLKSIIEYYINHFENDEIMAEGSLNYYNFKNNLYNLCKIWRRLYLDSGKNFNICSSDGIYDKKVRVYETLLYLLNKDYIKINNASFVFNKEKKETQDLCYNLIVNLTFLKSPDEIYDIHDFWDYSYGGIRVNEPKCIAYYKNNKYTFRSSSGRSFKLLCYLMKNPGKELSIEEVSDEIIPEYKNDSFKYKKEKIKDYVKEIKANLRIGKDKDPTVGIMIDGENIVMISNPPNPPI